MTKCLIDGDIVAFSVAAACEGVYYEVSVQGQDEVEHFKYAKEAKEYVKKTEALFGENWPTKITKRTAPEPVEFCLNSINKFLCSILEKFHSNDYTIFLTGDNNFRYMVWDQYKKQRKDTPPPTHLQAARDYLIEQWDAVVEEDQEADDGMAIAQCKGRKGSTVICTTDKDLLMVPGANYNWTKDEVVEVSELDGLRSFYRQLLTGDKVDNIPGIVGIGPAKASKIVDHLEDEGEMYEAVLSTYRDKRFPKGIKHPQVMEELEDEVIRNARLLWMRREEGEIWSPPGERS